MAIQERSLGPLYFASVETNVRRVPVHTCDVHGMDPPFRRGRAVVLPWWAWRGLMLGWWRPTVDQTIDDEFFEAQWYGGKLLDNSVDEISKWRADDEDSLQEAET